MRGSFPVSNAGLTAAFEFLTTSLRCSGRDETLAHRFSVILDEICANMIRHDTTLDEATQFDLDLTLTGTGAVLVISDPGQPFNPLEFRHAVQPEVGGHGITLIKGLSSAVSYARRDDRNELTVVIENTEE